ncbi:F-box only protein 28, partial [Stegodyphus mimosarum]
MDRSHEVNENTVQFSWQHMSVQQQKNMTSSTSSFESNEKSLEHSRVLGITDLPYEIIEYILRFFPFSDIGRLRMVSRYFNNVSSSILNSEFNCVRTVVHQKLKSIKAQMPRRESSRRRHPLARECDIIETLFMRLTLLNLIFGKQIEKKYCCFFPGQILDEVYKILKYTESTPNLNDVYKVTDELFDLSTMAIEYFKEHIEPTIPEFSFFTSDVSDSASLRSVSKAESSDSEEEVTVSSTERSFQALNKCLSTIEEIVKQNRKDISTLQCSVKLVVDKANALEKIVQQLKWEQKSAEEAIMPDSCKIKEILVELNLCKHQIGFLTSQLPESQSTNNTSAMVSKTSSYSSMDSYPHCSRSNKNQHIVNQNQLNKESDYLPSQVKLKSEEMLKKKKSAVSKKYSVLHHKRKRALDCTETINFKQKKKRLSNCSSSPARKDNIKSSYLISDKRVKHTHHF